MCLYIKTKQISKNKSKSLFILFLSLSLFPGAASLAASLLWWSVTCDEAHGGAVAAAERRVTPRHHGNTEIIIPGRQQVGHPLRGNREKYGEVYAAWRHDMFLVTETDWLPLRR